MSTLLAPPDYRQYFEKGLTYDAYLARFNEQLPIANTIPYGQYLPMNMQRTKRVGKTVRLTDEVLQAVQAMSHQIYWLMISEHWCGDASQTLPVMQAIAESSNGKIDLRIVYRDENPELMSAHLTGTSRSIPILIQLNEAFEPTNSWGPRPLEAQNLVLTLKSNPETAATYSEKLHKWYADDKTLSTQKEFLTMIPTTEKKLPLPPFTEETAKQKIQMAEDAWNSKDPERVSKAYTVDSEWRNRNQFVNGREEIVQFLSQKWQKELDYKLKKEYWAHTGNRIAVRFEYEYRTATGQWFRAYGNENWEFDENGLMQKRYASINDLEIAEKDRRLF